MGKDEREIGVVMSGSEPKKLKVCLYNEYVHSEEPVWNALVKVPYRGNSFAVGVISHYRGFNSMYEDSEFVRLIGSEADRIRVLRALRDRKENYSAEVLLGSAFTYEKGRLKRVRINSPIKPGTPVYRLRDRDLNFGEGFYYLGRFCGENILQPLYIEDFQSLGEAYHFVVAGQSGSGKSTIAMLLMCLYAKASKEGGNGMSFVILSPVPEFVKAFEGNVVGSFGLNIGEVFRSLGYSIEIYNEGNLVFDRWEVLKELLLLRDVWNYLEIRAKDNREFASLRFVELANKRDWALSKLYRIPEGEIRSLLSSDAFINHVYKPEEYRERLRQAINNVQTWEGFYHKLQEILSLFSEDRGRKVSDLARALARGSKAGKVVVIDMGYGGDIKLQSMLLKEIVDTIRKEGESIYRDNPSLNLNTMIILDEAHNYVPSRIEREEEQRERLRHSIVRAFAETRKFGIGWMAISTRISLLDRKIYEHARVKVIGYGLTTGMDREILREDFGKEVLERYGLFSDPSDPLSEKTHSFLISGPITILSREPELIQAFSSAEEFLAHNGFRL